MESKDPRFSIRQPGTGEVYYREHFCSTLFAVKTMVQARLDEETQAALDRLVRLHGWSTSRVVREGIRLVEKRHTPPPVRKLIGIGKYDSGVSNLATNKKYMDDFGKKSMGVNRRKPVQGPAE